MNAKKRMMNNLLLIIACVGLNILEIKLSVKLEKVFFQYYLVLGLMIGTYFAAMLGNEIAGVITTFVSGILLPLFLFPGQESVPYAYFCYGMAVSALISVFKRNGKLQEFYRNIILWFLCALVGSVIFILILWTENPSVHHLIYNHAFLQCFLLFLLLPAILIVTGYLITGKYNGKMVSFFTSEESVMIKTYRKHSIQTKLSIMLMIISLILISVSVFMSTITYRNQIITSSKNYAFGLLNSIREDARANLLIENDEEGALIKIREAMKKVIPLEPSSNVLRTVDIYRQNLETLEFQKICTYAITYPYSEYDELQIEQYEEIYADPIPLMQFFNEIEQDDIKHYLINSNHSLGENYWMVGTVSSSQLQEIPVFSYRLITLGLAVAFAIVTVFVWWLDRTMLFPMNKMAATADNFVRAGGEDRRTVQQQFSALEIHTGDEVENLHDSFETAMRDVLDYADSIREQSEHITAIQHSIITTMADIVESRDENTGGHIRRTACYVEIIANQLYREGVFLDVLNPVYINNMVVAAPLHDMGKIHVSDQILNKKGRLTDEEYGVMKTHAAAGKDLLVKATANLGSFEYLQIAIEMAGMHHEWWNGRGYPDGLVGDQIPLCARIMAVADVFDAIFSKRCYKEAMEFEEAFAIVVGEAGTHFDPRVIDAFVHAKEEIYRAAHEDI